MSAPTTLGAIAALFAGDATLIADFGVPTDPNTSGGLWVGGIPEERAKLPCCALMHHDDVPEWVLGNAGPFETGRFDLIVYARQLAVAEALAADIKAVFDPKAGKRFVPLLIDDVSTAWIQRLGYQVKLVQYRADDSTWVYEITLPYRSYVQR